MSGKFTAYNLTVRGKTSAGFGASESKENVFTREESMQKYVFSSSCCLTVTIM